MRNKIVLKVLAISIALVLVASSVAMYSYSSADVEKEISEDDREGVISLVAPPFVSVAGASEVQSSGGATPQTGTTFLEEEAGISAYVNVGKEIDLEKAKSTFKSIETSNKTYIIGQIAFDGYDPEYVAPHAYVHKDGWIVAYYIENEPSSKIMQWNGYDGGKITTTTLADAMHQICTATQIGYTKIEDNIKYYDFEYPNANRMMLITDITSENDFDSFNLTIPLECPLYEGSWSHYLSGTSSTYCGESILKIDENIVNRLAGTGTYFGYGECALLLREAEVSHEIRITRSRGTAGVATVLIYGIS